MPKTEPGNPFYALLLLASLLFAITALAYAVVPTLEERAAAAGRPAPPSALRDALRRDGWKWLLGEVAVMVFFGFMSMGLDRFRSSKRQRAEETIPPADPRSPGSETAK